MADLSRRAVLLGAGMVAFAMATPVFSIEIRDVSLALLGHDTATHTFEERHHETADGRRYRIFLALPTAGAPAAGRPIIYMLDGNAAFAALTAEQLAEHPNLIVATIGYEGDKAFDVNARSRDYTPPLPGHTAPVIDPQRPERLMGGAPAFLETLTGDLRAAIEASLSVDPQKRTLWGHSYGGLFTTYALLTQPNAFNSYAPTSPSLGWGDGVMEQVEAAAQLHTGTPANVLVMLGDMESRSGQPKLETPRPSPYTMSFIERLVQRDDLKVSSRVFEGAQHGQTFGLSLPLALALADS